MVSLALASSILLLGEPADDAPSPELESPPASAPDEENAPGLESSTVATDERAPGLESQSSGEDERLRTLCAKRQRRPLLRNVDRVFGCKDPRFNLWSVFFRFGVVAGGDAVFTLQYTDGSESSLRAGDGFYAMGGAQVTPLRIGRHSLTLAFEGGYKAGGLSDDDGTASVDVSFRRISLTPRIQYAVLVASIIGMHYVIGGGPSWDLNPRMTAKTSGFYPNLDETLRFDDAFGGVVETGLWFDGGFFGLDVSFRYTYMNYETPEKVLGHGFGVMFGILAGTPKPLPRSQRGEKRSSSQPRVPLHTMR